MLEVVRLNRGYIIADRDAPLLTPKQAPYYLTVKAALSGYAKTVAEAVGEVRIRANDHASKELIASFGFVALTSDADS